ncbi:MAG: arsenate reductase [Lautropia sp.]
MARITVYGIANCDQVRKTLAWLREHGIAHRFHDYRVDGLSHDALSRWCKHLPWTSLLNKRGQSWRSIPEPARRAVVDQASAIELMLANPTLVKRPVLEVGDDLLLGFSAERLAEAVRASAGDGGGDADADADGDGRQAGAS